MLLKSFRPTPVFFYSKKCGAKKKKQSGEKGNIFGRTKGKLLWDE